jgi:putative hydrolase of the HAD superfamily
VALLDRPKAVLLDFDGTLIDNSVVAASVEQACDSIATAVRTLDREQLLSANMAAWNEYWPEVERRCWLGEMDVLDVSREVWRRALEACGCDDAAIVDFAHATLRQIGSEMARLFDDVPDLLDALSNTGTLGALITNSSMRSQRARLQDVGLDAVFAAVVISGEIGVAKPDPAIFATVLERIGLTAAEVWHVGDSLSTDVAGAQAAGICSVWLNRTGQALTEADPIPDLQVNSLDEVAEMLRRH